MSCNKKPLGIAIISIAAVMYGMLDIAQLFMPEVTDKRIEYSLPFLGILLLVFGIGTFVMKEWARKGIIFASFLAIIQSGLAILDGNLLTTLISLIFIVIFGLIIYYFMRPSIKKWYTNANI